MLIYEGLSVDPDTFSLQDIPVQFIKFIDKGPSINYVRTKGEGGGGILYISIAYYMQKGGEGVQIACKIAYVINGRPPTTVDYLSNARTQHSIEC